MGRPGGFCRFGRWLDSEQETRGMGTDNIAYNWTVTPDSPDSILKNRIVGIGPGGHIEIARMLRITASLNRVFIWHPSGNSSNSNHHKGPKNSTSKFPYRIGADRAAEMVDAARARIPSFM